MALYTKHTVFAREVAQVFFNDGVVSLKNPSSLPKVHRITPDHIRISKYINIPTPLTSQTDFLRFPELVDHG